MQGAKRAEGDECDYEDDVCPMDDGGVSLHVPGEVIAEGSRQETLHGSKCKQRKDDQAHGMIVETLDEHALNAAAKASRKAAPGTRQPRGGLEPAQDEARAVRSGNYRQKQTQPGRHHAVFAEPKVR